jgi:hypothetical protein
VSDRQWHGAAAASLARLAGPHPTLSGDSLKAHADPASGMAVIDAAIVTFVVEPFATGADRSAHFVGIAGWPEWRCDGMRVEMRAGRLMGRDTTPPARWTLGPTMCP